MLSPKDSSCVCRLNGYPAQHSHNFRRLRGFGLFAVAAPGKPPEARRRCTGRHTTATSRLRSFCSRQAPRWTPRTTMARGLKVTGSRARNRVSDLGHLKKFFGFEILHNCLHFQEMYGKVMSFRPKMWGIGEFCVGINDHNVKCQYAWRTDDLCITYWTLLQIEHKWTRQERCDVTTAFLDIVHLYGPLRS